MGFLSGSATFERFRIVEDPTDAFGDSHLKQLEKFQIGKSSSNLYETPSIGFTAGTHVFDTEFSFEKNIIGDAMHFGIRVDSCSIPGPVKRAWMQIELAGIVGEPGKRPTKTQREEAKESVEQRCADEADKGNFRRMNETHVLWDSPNETLFLGSTSEKNNEGCLELLERAFGLETRRLSAGRLAKEAAEHFENHSFSCSPTRFLEEDRDAQIVWWNGMTENWNYLGNEFLLWLWWYLDTQSSEISLADNGEASAMFARTLVLDCPKGEFGKETISSDSPVALPETAMAVQMGKLPRKAGLTLVRDGEQYDLTLQAETFGISAARITQLGDSTVSDQADRIDCIRRLAETADELYSVFCDYRTGSDWKKVARKISQWLDES